MNKISKRLPMTIAAVVVSLASVGQALAAQHESTSAAQWMERMQSHWQQVISETDTLKRRELMREHEQMMTQAAGPDDAGAGRMGMDGSHVDVMNTVDMHQHMIDMMR